MKDSMKTHFAIAMAAVSMLLATLIPAQASQFSIQGNSIIEAYSTYCDPMYFATHQLEDGEVDPNLVQQYEKVLLVKFMTRCDAYFKALVSPVDTAAMLLTTVPELQREGGGQLSAGQLQILGGYLAYKYRFENTGCGDHVAETIVKYDELLKDYWERVGAADALNIAAGYGHPPKPTTLDCPVAELLESNLLVAMFGERMADPFALGMMPDEQTQEQKNRDAMQQLLERGEQIENGYEHDQPDGTSAEQAVKQLSGWWRYAEYDFGCDDTDDMYRMALGAYHRTDSGDVAFGEGSFGIGKYENPCDLSDLKGSGGTVIFHALCYDEDQQPYSGEGRLNIVAPDRVALRLPGDDSDEVMIACPVSKNVPAEASPIARQNLLDDQHFSSTAPVSEDWVPFGGTGWSIELPADIANGPTEAITAKGKDVGTSFTAEDGSESLSIFAADIRGRPVNYLESRYAELGYSITYRFDRKAVAVVSGFIDGANQRTFYAKCISGAHGRCIELSYETDDSPSMNPVVERISKSFKPVP